MTPLVQASSNPIEMFSIINSRSRAEATDVGYSCRESAALAAPLLYSVVILIYRRRMDANLCEWFQSEKERFTTCRPNEKYCGGPWSTATDEKQEAKLSLG